jgi:glycosyltransferase involved in cell wall biosynthesis
MSSSLSQTYCIFDGLQWDNARGLGRFAAQLRKHVQQMQWKPISFCIPRWRSGVGKVLLNELVEPIFREALTPAVAFYPHNVLPTVFLSHRSVRVLVLHDFLFLDGKNAGVGNRYRSLKLRGSLSRADVILTVSETSRAEILRRLDRECPVFVISNALAESFGNFNQTIKPKHSGPFSILHFGGNAPTKNTKNVLKAVQLLNQRGHHVHLELAAMYAKKEIVARWQQEIRFPGHALAILPSLSDAELLEAYAKADAHCMPSTGEGFGIPVIEAARTSTLNILSPLPVFREIAGDDAVFTASCEAEDIADAILTSMSANTQGMTIRARQRSHNFLFDSIHAKQAVPALQAIADLRPVWEGKVRE